MQIMQEKQKETKKSRKYTRVSENMRNEERKEQKWQRLPLVSQQTPYHFRVAIDAAVDGRRHDRVHRSKRSKGQMNEKYVFTYRQILRDG
jgi:hypothetical protein